MYEIFIEDTFDAAHKLRGYQGKCENLHGHTFKVQVFLRGDNLDKKGMLIDFKKVKSILKKILSDFDHKNLNEISYFKKENPTSENIAKLIFKKLKQKIRVYKVSIFESEGSCASYYE